MAERPVVVIVDDEPDLAATIREVIELELRYDVMAAASPEEGLAMLKALEQTPPDLLIVDYRMPRIDGVRFVLRARKLFPDLPAIMVTAFADLDLVMNAARQLHIARFLRKPLRPETLLAAVQEVVSVHWLDGKRKEAFDRSTRVR